MNNTGTLERRPLSAMPKSAKFRSPTLYKASPALQTSSSKGNFSRRPETAKKEYLKSPGVRSNAGSNLDDMGHKQVPHKIDFKKNQIEIVCTSKEALNMKNRLNSINFSTQFKNYGARRCISPNMVFEPSKTKD